MLLSVCLRSLMVSGCLHAYSSPQGFITDLHAGVKSYNVSLETQTAEIVAEESLDYETVLEKIKKTGKKVNSGEADGTPKDV